MPAIRQRTVSMLRNASEELAEKVAAGLGMEHLPDAMPLALAQPAAPEVTVSPMLSLMARPGDGSIRGRKIALLIARGVVAKSMAQVQAALLAEGAVARLVAPHIGSVAAVDGEVLQADASLENEPGFLFDALVLPDGQTGVDALAMDGHTMEFIKDQYRHCKTILVMGASTKLMEKAGIPSALPDGNPDTGIITALSESTDDAIEKFIKGVAQHRHPQRETDPPRV